ncbi:hypothetical protein [Gloeomargarita sp.]
MAALKKKPPPKATGKASPKANQRMLISELPPLLSVFPEKGVFAVVSVDGVSRGDVPKLQN